MMINLAADHAGFQLKETIKSWLHEHGHQVIDHGALAFDDADDFPDTIEKAAAAVSQSPGTTVALIFGGSGQGEAMLANRFPGVRATAYYAANPEIIRLSREHNNANVLSVGARFVSAAEVIDILPLWLNTPPLADPKYARRNQKIEAITKTIRNI